MVKFIRVMRSRIGVSMLVMIAPILVLVMQVYDSRAEDDTETNGIITDYNADYYESYDEAVGDGSAHFLSEDDWSVLESTPQVTADVPVYNTVDEAGAYLRSCMVKRSGEAIFVLKNTEGYTGKEGFALIKTATFIETDSPVEGDYLYWNYAGLEGRYDSVDEGMLYTLYPTYLSTAEQEKEIDARVDELLADEFAGWQTMSDFEITKKVYKWITANFKYVSSSDNHSTYSGMIEMETVCQGFATSAYRLLREMNVSCRVVANNYHGWNIVKIGNYYYNIDATWDVGLREQEWVYFLLNNENFEKGDMHIRGLRYMTEEFNAAYPMSGANYNWTPDTINVDVEYRTHVQSYGWQPWVSNGTMSGTEGQSKRLEAINICVKNSDNLDLCVEYMTHIQSYGWESDWRFSGELSGTAGRGKRLEAIKIQLTGEDSDLFDIYYRVHVQSYGWLGWAKNGESAGSSGLSKRLEGIEIVILPKGTVPDGTIGYSYIAYGKNQVLNESDNSKVSYKTHVQTYGWQKYVSDGAISGTFNEAKRLEGINISLGDTGYSGGIRYKTHVQTYGWEQDWKYDGDMSGTSGQAKRLEAIQIELYGEVAEHYDVYYRVHAQTYGWLGWAKNGESAGTEGMAKRLEAIQIVLIPKNSAAPAGTGSVAFVK